MNILLCTVKSSIIQQVASEQSREEHVARHYSTKDFFRQIPNGLLARYFHSRSLFGDLDFSAMKEPQPDDLFAAGLNVPDSQHYDII